MGNGKYSDSNKVVLLDYGLSEASLFSAMGHGFFRCYTEHTIFGFGDFSFICGNDVPLYSEDLCSLESFSKTDDPRTYFNYGFKRESVSAPQKFPYSDLGRDDLCSLQGVVFLIDRRNFILSLNNFEDLRTLLTRK